MSLSIVPSVRRACGSGKSNSQGGVDGSTVTSLVILLCLRHRSLRELCRAWRTSTISAASSWTGATRWMLGGPRKRRHRVAHRILVGRATS